MTQIAAICHSLLKGDTLSIMNGYSKFNCTNLPRELSRSVEKKFDVEMEKTPTLFVSAYGHVGEYYKYRLIKNERNKKGIEKMKIYLAENMGEYRPKKKESKEIKADLFSEILINADTANG
jgi:hypothetical protein